MQKEVLLEKTIDWWRLCARPFQSLSFQNRHSCSPISSPTDAMQRHPSLVYIRPGTNVVEYARQQAIRILINLYRSLACSRTIYGEKSYAVRQNRAEALR